MRASLRAVLFGATGPTYSAEATAYFAAMSSQPDATRKGLIDTLIAGLKTDGVWSKLDLFYLLASHDAQSRHINAKTPGSFTTTVVGSVTFTVDRGDQGDGSTGYLNTGLAQNAGGNYTQNSASLFSWINSSTGTTEVRSTIYCNNTAFLIPDSSPGFYGRANADDSSTFGNPANRLGSRCISRTGSTTTNGQVNGAASGSTSAIVSTLPSPFQFTLLGDGSTFNGLDRLACAALGGGLSGAQMTALHNRVSTYLTAIGAN